MPRAAIRHIGKMNRLWVLFMVVLFMGYANAADTLGGGKNTKRFGKLSLSLSMGLETSDSETGVAGKEDGLQRSDRAGNGKTLSELNVQIVSLEEMIKAQQKQLGIASRPAQAPPISDIPSVMPPVEAISADHPQSAMMGGASSVAEVVAKESHENVKPQAVVPVIRQATSGKEDLIGGTGVGQGWVIGLGVLLLGGLGYIWFRRSGTASTVRFGDYHDVSESHEEPELFRDSDASLSDLPTMRIQDAVEPQHKLQSILPPEYELLEEADIYLRFGHDKLAEETLREALKINPKNPHAYLTLLRIYFSREDNAAFLELAQQLKSLGDQSVWSRVAEMGRNLDADNPLYH